MKQLQRAKRRRGSAGGRPDPLAVDPRDPDIVHAHQIARRRRRAAPGRVRPGSHDPAAPVRGRY
jgi:hypothetical protein